jgi:Tol biopolymer transport system component
VLKNLAKRHCIFEINRYVERVNIRPILSQSPTFATMKLLLFFLILFCPGYLLLAQVDTDFKVVSLTSAASFANHPTFSQDGSQIAFSSEINGFEQLFVFDIEEHTTQQLTFDPANSRHPSWHPNAKQIIYDSDIDGKSQLYGLDLESRKSQVLFKRDIAAVAGQFNSQTNLLVFVGKESNQKYWNIYSYDFTYNNLNKISDHNSHCHFPKWSPRSEYISYHTAINKNQHKSHIIHWYGKPAFDPTVYNNNMSGIAWSPTGYKIVFVVKNDDFYQLFFSQRDGTEVQLLASSSHAIQLPDWSPDGRSIIFTLTESVDKQNIWLLNLE